MPRGAQSSASTCQAVRVLAVPSRWPATSMTVRHRRAVFNSLYTGEKAEAQRGWVPGSRSSSEGGAEPDADPA